MNSFFKMIKNPSVQIFSLALFYIIFDAHIPHDVKRFFFTISINIKKVLFVVLPFVIISYIASSIANFAHSGIKLVLILVFVIIVSNTLSCLFAFSSCLIFMPTFKFSQPDSIIENIKPFFEINIKSIIQNQYAIIIGIIIGFLHPIIDNLFNTIKLKSIVVKFKNISDFIMQKIFIKIIALFVFGFFMTIDKNDLIGFIDSPVIFFILICDLMYVFLMFMVISKFNIKNAFYKIKNIMPSFITGAMSMSSAASMPVVINDAIKNGANKNNVNFSVPFCINSHLVGDCIGIITLSIAILFSFNINVPDISSFLLFLMYFVLAKFAVLAIPGGGIIIMAPIIESYFGLSAAMIGMITTFYILSDFIMTSFNIAGNGALTLFINKLFIKIQSKNNTL